MLFMMTLSGLFSCRILREVETFLLIIVVRRKIVARFSDTLEVGMVGMCSVWSA